MARSIGWLLGFGVVVWLLIAFHGSGKATELPAVSTAREYVADVPARAPAPTPATETVRAGDGWLAIATRTGTDAAALMAANSATTATVIHPGDVVQLPGAGRAPGFPAKRAPVAVPVYVAPVYDEPYIGGGDRTERVRGYTRRDGTYVHSYRRPRR